MHELGKALVGIGLLLMIAGVFLWKLAGRTPLGRLPGDIVVQKPNFTFFFPITTCILISVVLTLLLWVFRR